VTQIPEDQGAVQQMWQAFRQATGTEAELTDVFAFGDSPAMADELAELVLRGPKRATAGLHLDYERANEPMPQPGSYSIVLDGRGQPVCIIATSEVQVKPMDQVDAAFAWDEGEGDRSLTWWLDAHRRFFNRRCVQLGVPFSESVLVVLLRFELVWPLPSNREEQ
jgi:uncharacterized protein YhfF